MTTASFIQNPFSQSHAGVTRVEEAVQAARAMGRDFDGARSLAAMLLAAMVAALVLAADQMIDTWAQGHLLAAWVALWAVGFTAIGLFAGSARRLAKHVVAGLNAWRASRAGERADERMWAFALTDARVMAEIVRAQDDAVPMLAVGSVAEARGFSSIESEVRASQLRRKRMLANRNDF